MIAAGSGCGAPTELYVSTRVQVGVCYQLAFNTVSYELLCQARTRVNFVIGQWHQAHGLMHSQSVQPGFMVRGDKAGADAVQALEATLSPAPPPPAAAAAARASQDSNAGRDVFASAAAAPSMA
jgi:hypothetical protein